MSTKFSLVRVESLRRNSTRLTYVPYQYRYRYPTVAKVLRAHSRELHKRQYQYTVPVAYGVTLVQV